MTPNGWTKGIFIPTAKGSESLGKCPLFTCFHRLRKPHFSEDLGKQSNNLRYKIPKTLERKRGEAVGSLVIGHRDSAARLLVTCQGQAKYQLKPFGGVLRLAWPGRLVLDWLVSNSAGLVYQSSYFQLALLVWLKICWWLKIGLVSVRLQSSYFFVHPSAVEVIGS